MKEDTSSLTSEDYDLIRKWLEEGIKPSICPYISCKKCGDLFPEIPTSYEGRKHSCPCNYYNREYVIKVAKKILKELNKKEKTS